MDSLYHEDILDLYKHPLHKGKLETYDVKHREHNPLCSDTVELFIRFGKNNAVTAIAWQGEGCAISQAATSLVTDQAKGKTIKELSKITKEDVLEMLGLEKLNPTRLRCALLGLKTLEKALAIYVART